MQWLDRQIAAPIARLPGCATRGAPWLEHACERWSDGRPSPYIVRIWRPSRHGDRFRCAIEVEPDTAGPRAVDAPTAIEALAAALARLNRYADLAPAPDATLRSCRITSVVDGVRVRLSAGPSAEKRAQHADDLAGGAWRFTWRVEGPLDGEGASRVGSPPLYGLRFTVQKVVDAVRRRRPGSFHGVAVALAELPSGGRRLAPDEVDALGSPALQLLETTVWPPEQRRGEAIVPVRFGDISDDVYAFAAPSVAGAWLAAGHLACGRGWDHFAWLRSFWAGIQTWHAEHQADSDASDAEPSHVLPRPTQRPDGPPLLELAIPVDDTTIQVCIWPSVAEDPRGVGGVRHCWWEAPPVHDGDVMIGQDGQSVLMALRFAAEWRDRGDLAAIVADWQQRRR
ncbi:MAG: hypothetical protein H6747_01455 [Deltaproteobacteria bacterium]|nr:hypothetical protein [Deltaproteobacteria bacterium]